MYIVDNNINFSNYIANYEKIKDVEEFLEWIDSIFVFLKKRVEEDIDILNKNIGIEIRDVDLFKMWMLVDGSPNSKIEFYEVLKEKKDLFIESDFHILKKILNKMSNEMINFEAILKLLSLYKDNIEFNRNKIISNYNDFLKFKKRILNNN